LLYNKGNPMKKQNLFSRAFQDSSNYELPFFLFLTLIMLGLYVAGLFTSTALHPAWKVVMFSVLMFLHIGLYWCSSWVIRHRQWLGAYLLLQLGLALSIGMLSRVIGVAFGLYPGLIGLLIGFPLHRGWKILTIFGVLAVSALNYTLLAGLDKIAWWLLVTVPVVVFITLYVLMYMRQGEARARAQSLLKDLETANRQLSGYAARVEDLTIAAERQRMARELHDTLSQGLAGLILQLEAVDAHLAGDRTERARSILEQSMQKARETLAEARQAIDDLRRPQATDLAEAVRQEAGNFRAATGIPCEPDIDLPAVLPEAVFEAAVKAVSESLTNVARHARAKTVGLRLAETDEGLEIEVRDDGIGFDPAAVETGHYGLLGMRERVRLTGGSLEIESGPGRGTRINIRLPLEKVPHA